MSSSSAAFSNAATGVTSLNRPGIRRIVSEPVHSWYSGVNNRLNHLVRLPTNWNGYLAGPVEYHVASFTVNMLLSACSADTAEPAIVPGPNGDLQVEWHLGDYDIELHVTAPFAVKAVRFFGEECDELDLTNDFTVVSEWLREMENAVAARRTAA